MSALPSKAGWFAAGEHALRAELANAAKAEDLRAERVSLHAAEQAVSQVADAIRSSRPADCDFQEEVLAALKP